MKSLWKSFCSLKMSTVFAVTTALTFFFLSGDQAFAEGLTLPFVTILTDLQNTLVNDVAPVLAVLGIAILGFDSAKRVARDIIIRAVNSIRQVRFIMLS